MDGKKMWKKTGFGILFVAACFMAMYILMEFHGDVLMISIAAVVLLITAFLFLNAVFSDKAKKWVPQEDALEASDAAISGGGDGEFRLKIVKHMKEMENTQKELIEVLKNQNTLLQTQIENLEHEIYMLSEKQVNQTKSIIKYNKENARQLAISERETLEYIMIELKKSIEDNAGVAPAKKAVQEEIPVAETFATEEAVLTPDFEEVTGAELFEVSDLPGDDEFVMPDMPAPEEIPTLPEEEPAEETPAEEIEIPEMPDDLDLSELFDIPELFDETTQTAPEATAEEIPAAMQKPEEAAPAPDPLAGLNADPNAMMTPEDIAKLLEAMGQ